MTRTALAQTFGITLGAITMIILGGCGPNEDQQKSIARSAIARTLTEADKSDEVKQLETAVRTQSTLAGSTRSIGDDYDSRRSDGGLFGLGSNLGNAAGAEVMRRQSDKFAKLGDMYYAKLQIVRRRIAWSKMTPTEQEYVRKHDPEFMRWLDDNELKKLHAEGKFRRSSSGRP